MSDKKNMMFTILDGTPEEQKKSTEIFLDTLTEEEKKQSMSDEFAYLDEE